jgi:non-ribosomal peptide synthetase component F
MWNQYDFSENEVCLQKTSLNFVDSVWEIFGPILKGIPLVISSDEAKKDPKLLLDTVKKIR